MAAALKSARGPRQREDLGGNERKLWALNGRRDRARAALLCAAFAPRHAKLGLDCWCSPPIARLLARALAPSHAGGPGAVIAEGPAIAIASTSAPAMTTFGGARRTALLSACAAPLVAMAVVAAVRGSRARAAQAGAAELA
jgi:hypothetical protein